MRRKFKDPVPMVKPKPVVYGLSHEMTVGKWKGRTFRDIIDLEPSYLTWAMDSDIIALDNEAYAYYEKATTAQQTDLFSPTDAVPDIRPQTTEPRTADQILKEDTL